MAAASVRTLRKRLASGEYGALAASASSSAVSAAHAARRPHRRGRKPGGTCAPWNAAALWTKLNCRSRVTPPIALGSPAADRQTPARGGLSLAAPTTSPRPAAAPSAAPSSCAPAPAAASSSLDPSSTSCCAERGRRTDTNTTVWSNRTDVSSGIAAAWRISAAASPAGMWTVARCRSRSVHSAARPCHAAGGSSVLRSVSRRSCGTECKTSPPRPPDPARSGDAACASMSDVSAEASGRFWASAAVKPSHGPATTSSSCRHGSMHADRAMPESSPQCRENVSSSRRWYVRLRRVRYVRCASECAAGCTGDPVAASSPTTSSESTRSVSMHGNHARTIRGCSAGGRQKGSGGQRVGKGWKSACWGTRCCLGVRDLRSRVTARSSGMDESTCGTGQGSLKLTYRRWLVSRSEMHVGHACHMHEPGTAQQATYTLGARGRG